MKDVYVIWMYEEDAEEWTAVSVADTEMEAMEYVGDRDSNYEGLVLTYSKITAQVPKGEVE
jgi:hypothetical protein